MQAEAPGPVMKLPRGRLACLGSVVVLACLSLLSGRVEEHSPLRVSAMFCSPSSLLLGALGAARSRCSATAAWCGATGAGLAAPSAGEGLGGSEKLCRL